MRLLSLKLENFQGIKDATFEFDGYNAAIYGDNATGKTTVFNAITWLLFGSASTGAKGYTPKTRGEKGDLHHLTHAATAVFIMDTGRELILKKAFSEVYKKKKGSPVSEFSGHTTEYFIDGVPSKEKEYQAVIDDICEPERLKILTMPHYFSENMKWETRRRLLIEICGDITDDEIIDSTPELLPLRDMLKTPGTSGQIYDIDEFRKLAAPKKAAINKELEEIPNRIDEASRSLSGVEVNQTKEQIDTRIEELREKYNNLQMKYNEYAQGDSTSAEIIGLLSDANIKMAELKSKYWQSEQERNAAIHKSITEIEVKISDKTASLEMKKRDLKNKQAELERLNDRRAALIREYSEVQKQSFDEKNTICPTCGREYPEDKIKQMLKNFNTQKSEKLIKLNEEGKQTASKEMIAKAQQEIDAITESIITMDSELTDLGEKLKKTKDAAVPLPPFECSDEYKKAKKLIDELTARKENARKDTAERCKGIIDDMDVTRLEIEDLQSRKAKINVTDNIKSRITELEHRERELADEYEKLENALYLCDMFVKEKVSRLTDKISERFKSVSFRLFQEQINGGIKEDCEVLIPTAEGRLIPYAYANNAARINAGLEIIGVLSEYWNIEIPVFVDNAESITKLTDIPSQTIRLLVSEPDKVLRTEIARTI